MISDKDLLYHTPEHPPHDWAETGYFNFYVPERNLLVWMYIVHRPGVGATVSDVEIIDRWADKITEAVYIDYTNHNPLPSDARSFNLPSGLSFDAQSLTQYRLRYDAAGIRIDVEFSAIMPPFDIHDPAMDPMAVSDTEQASANSGFGTAYASHFDMSVRAKGRISIGSETHQVDCICTMDHSWGQRPESNFQPMTWTNAHFGEDYVLHAIFHFDKDARIGRQHEFKHGYALVDGRVRGIKAASVRTIRSGLYPVSTEISLTDVDNRKHRIFGTMLNHQPWQIYGNNLSPMSMAQWLSHDRHDVGIGTYFEGWPLNRIRKE